MGFSTTTKNESSENVSVAKGDGRGGGGLLRVTGPHLEGGVFEPVRAGGGRQRDSWFSETLPTASERKLKRVLPLVFERGGESGARMREDPPELERAGDEGEG